MNYGIIRYIIGKVLRIEGVILIFPLLLGLLYREMAAAAAFLVTIAICLGLSVLLSFKKPKSRDFFVLEGYMTVALSWLLLSLFGALPFCFSGAIPSYVDALFETISGFTTTGASILSDVEALPKCMLFWRSFTHWIGGMGVLVFVLAVLPDNGGAHMYLMKAESPGPSVEKLVPRLRNTALILYGIYTFMTFLEIFILLLGKMPVFDAVTISLGTAGTGGFGIKNSSLGGYSPFIQNVVTVFMILFGVNFNIFYLILVRKWKQAWRSEELRTYLGIIFVSIAIVTAYIIPLYGGFSEALRHAAFQVGSIITTTGYSTTDFNLWQQAPKTILVILMFVGACAGSTGGGMKVSRMLIALKTVGKEIFNFIHPHGVKKVKMDGHVIAHETVRAVNVYLVSYVVILIGSVLLLAINNFDFTTNFTAVAATFNNIGPGLELVGPTQNFGIFSDFSKGVMMFDMLAGRLEIFPILVLFAPHTWKKAAS